MNRLEEQLFEAFNNPEAYSLHGKPGFELEAHYARIAAKICLEIAEKSHRRGYQLYQDNDDGGEVEKGFEDFKREIL